MRFQSLSLTLSSAALGGIALTKRLRPKGQAQCSERHGDQKPELRPTIMTKIVEAKQNCSRVTAFNRSSV